MLTLGYRIPGSTRGQAFTVPDDCHGHISEEDVHQLAERMRESGREPSWQAVRGAVIRLVKSRRKADAPSKGSLTC